MGKDVKRLKKSVKYFVTDLGFLLAAAEISLLFSADITCP